MKDTRILLVDDDLEDQEVFADAFNTIDCQPVIHFEDNGENALAYMESCWAGEEVPSLIVLDLNMPRMNGTQTLRALKGDERFRGIPVIIYSTSLNLLEKEQCMELGAHAYLMKPVTYAESLERARMFHALCHDFG